MNHFDRNAILSGEEEATAIHIVPTHLVGLLALPDREQHNLRHLEHIWYAASPVPVESS